MSDETPKTGFFVQWLPKGEQPGKDTFRIMRASPDTSGRPVPVWMTEVGLGKVAGMPWTDKVPWALNAADQSVLSPDDIKAKLGA